MFPVMAGVADINEVYPSDRKRCGYLARYVKAIFDSNAIQRCGREAVLLALLIAAREDRLHYNEAPCFWRSELMERLNIASTATFDKVQDKAISDGLIHKTAGSRTKTPKYWTLTPGWLAKHMRRVQKVNASNSTRSKTERETERETERILEPSTQYPINTAPADLGSADPECKKPRSKTTSMRIAPPTVEEVQAYCVSRGNNIDAREFVDYYTANGWVQGRACKPIRDWKAAVRTWERNRIAPSTKESIPPVQVGNYVRKPKVRA